MHLLVPLGLWREREREKGGRRGKPQDANTSSTQHLVRSEGRREPLETSTTFGFAMATAPGRPSVCTYPGLRRRRP